MKFTFPSWFFLYVFESQETATIKPNQQQLKEISGWDEVGGGGGWSGTKFYKNVY